MNQNQNFTLKRSYLFGALIVIQFYLYFFYLKTESYTFLASYFLLSIPIATVIIHQKLNQKILILLGVITLIFGFFGIYSKEFPVVVTYYNMLYGFSALIASYALYKTDKSEVFVKVLFWSYTAFIFYHFYTLGFKSPELYNDILKGSSRNYLSGIFVLLLILLALTYEKIKKPTPLIYPLITFVSCVGLFGRSGIVFSLAMLIFLMAKQKNYRLIGVFAVGTIAFILVNLQSIILFAENSTNFTNGLSSERSIFINEYLTGITNSNSDFFFGRRIAECCSWIQTFQGNPHNSFIMGHMRYGVAHTLLSIGIVLYILLSKNITLILFGLVILSRFFVDQLGLFTPFDTVLFLLLFIIHGSKKKQLR